MKIGLIPINIGSKSVQHLVGIAKLAEAAGVESVWTYEHVMVPEVYESAYPYDVSGKMPAHPTTAFVDPLIALSAIAAHTSTLRLGTGVNILSQSNPLYLAKQAASLDFVSDGRFMLGVGIGWLREEFEAMGVPYERRGARFDDYLQAMKKVWSGELVSHHSDFLDWEGFRSYPLPVQKPHLPVIIGGATGKIFERIAHHGDGWFAPTEDPVKLAPMLEQLRESCDAIGRDFGEIEITAAWSMDAGMEGLEKMRELGVHRVNVGLFGLGADPVEGIDRLAHEVIDQLR